MSSEATAGFKPGRLRIYPSDRPVLELWLGEPRIYRIGRDPDCDVRIDDSAISREHLLIDASEDIWWAIDPGSKNGSRIDGRPLDKARLGKTCWFSLAGIPASFERLSASERDRSEQLTHHRQDTVKLLQQRLRQETATGPLLDRLLEGFLELTECARGALLLTDEAGNMHTYRLLGWDRFEGSTSTVQASFNTGQATVINDLAQIEAAAMQASIVKRRLRALICVPLKQEDRTRGALYAESEQPGKLFTELDVELTQALAEQAMLVLDAELLRRELHQLAGRR